MSDRKYRHRGYQDSGGGDRDREPRSRSAPPPPKKDFPRGRSVGSDAEAVFKCNRCGEVLRSLEEFANDTVCAGCGTDLHTCSHCRHWNPSARWECSKPIPERIADKHKRNGCSLFEAKTAIDLTGRKPQAATPDDARAAFDKLFKM